MSDAVIAPPRRKAARARRLCVAIGALALPVAAHAQSIGFDQNSGRSGLFDRRLDMSVAERPQPEFDPVPLQFGSFDVLGSMAGGVGYTDNIYATENDRADDAILTASTVWDVRSNWSRNAVRAIARGSLIRYASRAGENAELFGLGATGRYDLAANSSLQAGAQYSRSIVPRTSTRSPTSVTRRITFNELYGFAGGTFGSQQLRLIAVASYRGQRFDPVRVLDPGLLGVDFADRDLIEGRLRAEYAVAPSFYVFGEARGNLRRFPTPRLISRRSKGYEITAGVNFELAALLRGEVALGYIAQNFRDAAYRDYHGLAYHGRIEYFPTQLVTLRLDADREIDDSGFIGVGSYIANTYSLRADYERQRNWLFTPQIGFGRDRYEGLDLRYRRLFALMDVKYTFSRPLAATFQYQYQRRHGVGSVQARNFNVNSLQLMLTYRL